MSMDPAHELARGVTFCFALVFWRPPEQEKRALMIGRA